MHNLSDTIEGLEQQLEKAAAALAQMKRFGEDIYGSGAVIVFDVTFPARDSAQFRTEGDRVYTYAAIKGDDELWRTSGPDRPGPFTWTDLVQWWTRPADPDHRGVGRHPIRAGRVVTAATMVRAISRESVLAMLDTPVRGYAAPRRRWKSALHRLTEDLLNQDHARMTHHSDSAWLAYMSVVGIIEDLEDDGLVVVERQYESMGRCLGNPTCRISKETT